MKYFIISQPKSGTYLLANLLSNLGLEFSRMHLQQKKCKIWTGTIAESRNEQQRFSHKLKLEESVKLLQDNQFAVGHIHYNEYNKQIFDSFKKVLITRNTDAIRQSLKRFNQETTRNHSEEEILATANAVLGWRNESIYEITFEDILNENVESVDHLQNYLFGNIVFDSLTAIQAAKQQESITKSSIR